MQYCISADIYLSGLFVTSIIRRCSSTYFNNNKEEEEEYGGLRSFLFLFLSIYSMTIQFIYLELG